LGDCTGVAYNPALNPAQDYGLRHQCLCLPPACERFF
jgi:hypothetical protein